MRYMEMSLTKQTATREGEKDYITLMETDTAEFLLKRGETGIKVGQNKPRYSRYPMSSWDMTVQMYLNRGYIIVPGRNKPAELKEYETGVKRQGAFRPEPDKAADELVKMLRALARGIVEQNFSDKVFLELPTKEQIEEAGRLLKQLENGYETLSVKEFNQILCRYYSILPRRMRYLADHLAKGRDRHGRKLPEADAVLEKATIADKEKEFFDILVSLLGEEQKTPELKTACEAFGLEIRGVTAEEASWIKRKMGGKSECYVRAWKVVNKKTERDFNEFLEKENFSEKFKDADKGVSHLFHGSRGENFWSIITNGLTINPLNVVITGKAFGQGTYFAPDAVKSMGYTDKLGSKWANGSSATGLMGIYKVATGKRYNARYGCDGTLTWNKLQKIEPGAYCTWAERQYSGFCMDEVIIYQDVQSTIEYLIQFK